MIERRTTRTIAALSLAALLSACGADFDEEGAEAWANEGELGTEEFAVLNGTTTNKHPEVVLLRNGAQVVGSGVLIAPKYFLTAAHAADNGIDTLMGTSENGLVPLQRSVSWLRPLTKINNDVANNQDIAIGELTDYVLSDWPMATLVSAPAAGAQATLIGYGRNSSADCNAATGTGAGVKRYRTTTLGTSIGCKADSGGAWIAGGIDTPADVFGIQSGGGIFTRAKGYQREILGTMRGEDGDYEIGIDRWGGGDYAQISTASSTFCKRFCEQDGNCMSFTWDGFADLCFLKSGTGTPIPADENIISGVPTGLDRFDLPGGDFKTVTTSSADTCRLACARNAQCMAYTYVSQGQQCYLKNTRPAAASCPAGLSCRSGVRRTATPPQPPPPPPPPCGQCIPSPVFMPHWDGSLDWGTDRPGGDMPNMPIQAFGFQHCADQCETTNGCSSFTYVSYAANVSNPQCWLKNQDVPAVRDSTTRGMISGQKGRRHF